jgi:hypothetical protein
MQVKLGEGEASWLLDLTPAVLILSLPGVQLFCNSVPRKYNSFAVSHISGVRCDRQRMTPEHVITIGSRCDRAIWKRLQAGDPHEKMSSVNKLLIADQYSHLINTGVIRIHN